jgi:hypothetical protein
MLADLDLNSITDDRARQGVQQLLNLLEEVMADLRAAQAEIPHSIGFSGGQMGLRC